MLPDGVFGPKVYATIPARFTPVPAPTHDEMTALTTVISERITGLIERRSLEEAIDDGDEVGWGNHTRAARPARRTSPSRCASIPIAAIEHVTVSSLAEDAEAIQRGYISDQPTDYTAATPGNDLASGTAQRARSRRRPAAPTPCPPAHADSFVIESPSVDSDGG